MAIQFRCNIDHDISTFTGVHLRVDEYKFSDKGVAYRKLWRSDTPGWQRMGTWEWHPGHSKIIVHTGEFVEGGSEILIQYPEWDQAYKEYVDRNLLA